MKINPAGGANYIQGGCRVGKLDTYKKSRSMLRSDEASLSEEAVAFSKVMASIRGTEEAAAEDSCRIAAIRQRVQSGEYRVDSGAVAGSILGDLFG